MTKETFEEWFDDLGFLTYGEISDIEVKKDIITILQWKKDSIIISDEIPQELFTVKEYWMYLSVLGQCIEYGTSPRGAWLTTKGEEVLDYLIQYGLTKEDLE